VFRSFIFHSHPSSNARDVFGFQLDITEMVWVHRIIVTSIGFSSHVSATSGLLNRRLGLMSFADELIESTKILERRQVTDVSNISRFFTIVDVTQGEVR